MERWQDLIPLHLEVPRPWFYDPADGQRNRQMFTTVCMAIAMRPFSVRMTDLPLYTYNLPRSAPEHGILWSYHTIGDAPNVWRVKESPVYGYYTVDRLGYSGWSSLSVEKDRYRKLVDSVDLAEAAEHVAGVRKVLIERNLSKYDQSNEPFTPPGRYVFFPLQMIDDPVACFTRLDTIEVLAEAARLAKETRTYLVVKRHPRCRHVAVSNALRTIGHDNPYVVMSNASIHPLIAGCQAVLVANSGVGLEALFYAKPVYAFAASEYELAVHPIATLGDIAAAFAPAHAPDNGLSTRFLHFYLSRCCFHMDSINSVIPFLDRALDALNQDDGVQVPSVQDDRQQLIMTQSQLEATRRQLLKSEETVKALQKMAEEAVATANQVMAQSRQQTANPETARTLVAAQRIGHIAADAAARSGSAETALVGMLEQAYASYADLAGAWTASQPDEPLRDSLILQSAPAAALDAGNAGRNIGADAYQHLHDDDKLYQANNWLVDHIPALSKLDLASVVEIGCGNGRFIKAFAPHVRQAYALDWARSPLLDPLPDNVEFRQGDLLQLDIPKADLICSAHVLAHFEPEKLPALIGRLHAAGNMNYHVIACYDDGHSHLAILTAGQWLALFRRFDPTYHIVGFDTRRGNARQAVCVITNGPVFQRSLPKPIPHVGVWMWPGNAQLMLHPNRVMAIGQQVVGRWTPIDDFNAVLSWNAQDVTDVVRIDPERNRLEVTSSSGDQFLATRVR